MEPRSINIPSIRTIHIIKNLRSQRDRIIIALDDRIKELEQEKSDMQEYIQTVNKKAESQH